MIDLIFFNHENQSKFTEYKILLVFECQQVNEIIHQLPLLFYSTEKDIFSSLLSLNCKT